MFLVVATLSCAVGKTSFDSKVYPASRVAMDRLLIVANLENVSVGDKLVRGFSEGLTRGLALCQVASRILQVDSLDLGGKIDDAAGEFHATAKLAIVARGSELVKGRALSFAEKHHFELAIFDARSGNVAWRASSVLDLGTPRPWDDDALSGSRFAWSIVAQIRDDGVLAHCGLSEAGSR
jgi:hypothetical protein